jgi:hypothetical protein
VFTSGACTPANTNAATLTVTPNAAITSVSGTSPLCIGGTATYTASGVVLGGGTGAWSSSDENVATVSSAGLVSAVSAGTANIIYTITGGCSGTKSAQQAVTVSRNAICAAYTGGYFANTTSNTTGGSATVNLTYTISGAGCNGMAGLTAANFTVTNTADPSSTQVVLGTKTFNSSTGLVTIPVTITLGNGVYSAGVTFTLALVNAANYEFGSTTSCNDPVLVTVSTNAEGFVTGGGYIIPTNSTGTIGNLAVGLKTNFGFNIKYNKASTKLQGNWNMIMRTATGLWQVKSSQPTGLVISQVSATSYKADIVFSAANIKNLTTGTGYGTGTVNVTVYDNGEPGSGVDQIFIKVSDGTTNYYTSSSTTNLSIPGSIQKLNAGNIQIHTLGNKAQANTNVVRMIDQQANQRLQLNALPNPSRGSFTLKLQGSTSEKMQVRVVDIMGRTVQIFNNLSASQTLKIGADYKKGVYIVELVQGDSRTQTKLVKTD